MNKRKESSLSIKLLSMCFYRICWNFFFKKQTTFELIISLRLFQNFQLSGFELLTQTTADCKT